jgi:hypothetical protein
MDNCININKLDDLDLEMHERAATNDGKNCVMIPMAGNVLGEQVLLFITAGPSTKLFVFEGEGPCLRERVVYSRLCGRHALIKAVREGAEESCW